MGPCCCILHAYGVACYTVCTVGPYHVAVQSGANYNAWVTTPRIAVCSLHTSWSVVCGEQQLMCNVAPVHVIETGREMYRICCSPQPEQHKGLTVIALQCYSDRPMLLHYPCSGEVMAHDVADGLHTITLAVAGVPVQGHSEIRMEQPVQLYPSQATAD